MRIKSQMRFLAFYSASITLIFASTVYVGVIRSVHGASKATDFDRITVRRIDVVEPDGTPRLFISDRAEFPGDFYHGRELQRRDRRDSAGMLFLNDEGTEDGGLIYGGNDSTGKPSSFSHLSFDQYEQDQTVDLGTSLNEGVKAAGIQLNDAPERAITPALIAEADGIKAMPHGPERAAAWANFQKKYPALTERASLSRTGDGAVGLVLRDAQGRSRIEIRVTADGKPEIRLLNKQGKVKKQLSLEREN
jgi:hypothetical protein